MQLGSDSPQPDKKITIVCKQEKIIQSESFRYSKILIGIKYDKTVKYFFGYTKDMSFLIPEEFKEEISEVAWLPYEEALERSTFQETKDILNSILSYIKR